jgi:hypothetical protein
MSLWRIETDADRDKACSLSRGQDPQHDGAVDAGDWSQGGRLGIEHTGPYRTVMISARALVAADHRVIVEPVQPMGRDDALEWLARYRDARATITEAVAAAVLHGVSQSEIARLCGMSREGVRRTIERTPITPTGSWSA